MVVETAEVVEAPAVEAPAVTEEAVQGETTAEETAVASVEDVVPQASTPSCLDETF